MKYIARADKNHSIIAKALRQIGCSVVSLARVGGGCPDLMVSRKGRTVLFEIKTEHGKLNELQQKFHGSWQGEIATVKTWMAAVNIMDAKV